MTAEPTHTSAMIGIGAWNLDWAYARDLSRHANVLASHQADLWVLTETRDAILPAGLDHGAHSPVRPRDNIRKWTTDSRWASLWSRWPLKQISTRADPTRVFAAIVEPPAMAPIVVYGTVLPWNGDRLYRHGEKRRAIERQVDEWLCLKDRYQGCLMMVLGDFNQDMASKPARPSETLQEAIELGLSRTGLTCLTAPDRLGGCWPHRTIDHIAVSSEIAPRFTFGSAWHADPQLSDHGGIVVRSCNPC